MKYCKNCLQPDTRPNSRFNEKGIYPACSYHNLLDGVDWEERNEILMNVIILSKNHNQIYDCIIGVMEVKIVQDKHFLRDKLGLNHFGLLKLPSRASSWKRC